jgi:hypothetical protein
MAGCRLLAAEHALDGFRAGAWAAMSATWSNSAVEKFVAGCVEQKQMP